MSTKACDCNDNLAGLSDETMQILADWERKFIGKYPVVGSLEGSGLDVSSYQQPEEVSMPTPKGRQGSHPIVLGVAGVVATALSLVLAVGLARWS